MDDLVSTIIFALVWVIATATSLRILWRSRRTKGVPELLWGSAWLASNIAAVAEVAIQLSSAPNWRIAFHVAYLFLYGGSNALVCLSFWRIFRPRNRAIAAAAIFGVICLAVAFVYQGLATRYAVSGLGNNGLASTAQWIDRFVAISALLWLGVESTLAYRANRKRAKIGMYDRLTGVRLLLWAVTGYTFAGSIICYCVVDWGLLPSEWLFGIDRGAIVLGVCALWLAFFPPRSWQHWSAKGDGRLS